MQITRKYELAADLLEDIWLHIDWEKVGAGRRMKIWAELEGQARGLSRCYVCLILELPSNTPMVNLNGLG